MTPVAQASVAEPQAEIDLSALFGAGRPDVQRERGRGGQVFTRGDYAYVPRYKWTSTIWRRASGKERLKFYVVDISDRSAPRAVRAASPSRPARGDTYHGHSCRRRTLCSSGVRRATYGYDPIEGVVSAAPRFFYDAIELGNPSAPTVAEAASSMLASIAGNGWGHSRRWRAARSTGAGAGMAAEARWS